MGVVKGDGDDGDAAGSAAADADGDGRDGIVGVVVVSGIATTISSKVAAVRHIYR